MEHFPHLTAVCDLITDLMDLDMKPVGVGPVCRILAKRREEDGHLRGERSHLKDEERYPLCGLG
jgi:hypothetical protein